MRGQFEWGRGKVGISVWSTHNETYKRIFTHFVLCYCILTHFCILTQRPRGPHHDPFRPAVRSPLFLTHLVLCFRSTSTSPPATPRPISSSTKLFSNPLYTDPSRPISGQLVHPHGPHLDPFRPAVRYRDGALSPPSQTTSTRR